MKTTVEIPDSLLTQAKQEASRRGTTLRAVLEEGLRAVLGKDRAPRPFRLRKAAFRGRGLGLDLEGSWESVRRRSYEGRGE
ncbi:MAG: DUF2191 domain-containing protein [Thermoanaerobaculia bacterium]